MTEPQLTIPFPCYALMNNACNGGVVFPRGDGTVAMTLFTSDDKVRKFRAANASQMFAGPTVKFDWDHEFLLYLNHLPTAVTHIVVDPEQVGGSYLNFTVAAMKVQLQKSLRDPNQP